MSKREKRSHRARDESTLFVSVKGSRLPHYITGQHLREHFKEFEDAIVSARVWREKDTVKSRGYGFIKFLSSVTASEAKRKLDGSYLRGKFPLNVKYARKDPEMCSVSESDSDSNEDSDSESSSTTCTLYVGAFKSKFPNHINTGHLRQHFSEFEHSIENAMIIRDAKTKQTKGYGFITFTSHADAKTAMIRLRGSKLLGKFKLFINFKDSKRSTSATPSLTQSRASSMHDLASCYSQSDSEYSSDELDPDESECKLYVSVNKSRFPNYVNSRHLSAHFSEYKEHIKKAMIVRDFKTKQSKGYGFVTFSSKSVAESAMKKLRGSKLDGKFSLFISMKNENVDESSSASFAATPGPSVEKSTVPLSGTNEQLLYIKHRFFTYTSVKSTAFKNSLSAQLLLQDGTLYLHGTKRETKRAAGQIYASDFLRNLQSRAFSGKWHKRFVSLLRDSVVSLINEPERDRFCILHDSQEDADDVSFTIHVFSRDLETLELCLQRLNELKPQSKLFQLRPEYNTVSGLTEIFLSLGKDHCTVIQKESGQGVRIYGLKSEQIQICWTALKSFVDSRITVTHEITTGYWEAKYIQSKCIHTLEMEGCTVQFPVFTTMSQQAKVNIVLNGRLKSAKEAADKIKDLCSRLVVQSFDLNCKTKYVSLWLKRWEEMKMEQVQNDSDLLIDVQRKHQSGVNQVVQFTIVGLNSTTMSKVKNDIIARENGSKNQLPMLDVTLTGPKFDTILNNLEEYEQKLKQTYHESVIVEFDCMSNSVQLITTHKLASALSMIRQELIEFIDSKSFAGHKSITKELVFKDKVVMSLLSSRMKAFEREAAAISVGVQHDQSHSGQLVIKLSGKEREIKVMEQKMDSAVKGLTVTIKNSQLVLDGRNQSIICTDSFKTFCLQLLKDLHVECIYHSSIGEHVLRQVLLKSKPGHILTLQIVVGQLCDEEVDAIVVPARTKDETMRKLSVPQPPTTIGEVICTDSGAAFSSDKALHVLLPKSCVQVEEQVDFVTACSKALDYASSNNFGTLSIPALGVRDVHDISSTLCANTLLYCVDKHCLNGNKTTLHTIRIVITKDLNDIFISCFDKYTFKATQVCEAGSGAGKQESTEMSPSRYEWYWEDDKKNFTLYPPTISDRLTQAKLTDPDKKCIISFDSKAYIIDLSAMTQRNVTSGFTRKVLCKEVPTVTEVNEGNACAALGAHPTTEQKVQWYYRDDRRRFTPYFQSDSTNLENMYQKVSSTKYLRIQTRWYKFDFQSMKQVNISTMHQRDIKRDVITTKPPSGSSQEVKSDTRSSQCVVNLRGPEGNLEKAKQMIEQKLESLVACKTVPLPTTATASLKQKIFSIARRHSVSSSIREHIDDKSKVTGVKSQQKLSQVIRIEGAEHMVDKAVTEVQSEIIEFHTSQSSPALSTLQSSQYPPEWETQTSTSQLFDLEKYSHEWIRVTSLFRETMPDADILHVKRIQNKRLWERYSQQKEWMHEKNAGVVNEKELWHGSKKSTADNIYASEEGFDMRYSSEGLWGQANYFAEKASYSNKYALSSTGGTKELLLAKVLTGESFESRPDPSLRMPPEKPTQSSNVQLKQLRYDSVTGTTCNCRVYMTYANDKAYPAYLVSYLPTPSSRDAFFRRVPPIPQSRSARLSSLLSAMRANSGFTQ